MKLKSLLIAALLGVGLFSGPVRADEGMWLPHLLKSQNYEEMKRLGLKLSPEEIYSVNNSSLKDAIVRLGRGFCTGEMISAEGLMLTNHHCGFGAIQSQSSPEHDYLKDGFWAMKRSDELKAGFGVSFLQRIEDVTERVTKDLTEEMTARERMMAINKIYGEIAKEVEDTAKHISGDVKSMFDGNKYYLLVYQTYPDVRLVGAPPSSIGKYGGDTDNWMWPRHTGDFSMFRVYANSNNEPAEYSPNNVPYKPKHHLPVNIKGVKENDYVMIFGYPGSTDRYLTSQGVKWATDHDQPARVNIRRQKLDIYEAYMAQSSAVNIQYASKRAQVSNYWKYFIGQTKGLKRLNVYDKKKQQEDAFMAWANANPDRKAQYGEVVNLFDRAYAQQNRFELARTYLNEAIFGIESVSQAYGFMALKGMLDSKETSAESIQSYAQGLRSRSEGFFKDYYLPIDREVCAAMLKVYYENIPSEQQPEYLKTLVKKFKGDFTKMSEWIYKKSFLVDQAKMNAFLDKPNGKKLGKDPVYKLVDAFITHYRNELQPELSAAGEYLTKAQRLYAKGLMEMNPNTKFYPNANSTMRVTYGQVLDYFPADAVYYNYFTTAKGIMEKYVPGDEEFDLPQRFIDLYKEKNFGRYGKDGDLRICFISNNDITGGNSGSPVINAEGHLVGTAFDGNWEAMSGDIAFEPELQRTISVDIRYTLWVIDVFAGAGHLVKEMTVIE
ncbi:MAG: S46 family peptidase [Flavobacteriales bacterium]|nr:S46 family peptidase [Flavobacteriales bacterium]